MRGKEGIYWTILCLGLLVAFWNIIPATDVAISLSKHPIDERILAGDPHDPIIIDGDKNFRETAFNEGWAGDGSEGDPFVIERYDINRGGVAGHCISISNTRVNFTIIDCSLTGANINPGSGIYLDNVSYVNIMGNYIYFNYHGIFLIDSDINTISDNDCLDNTGAGVYLLYSESNILTDNTCYSNTFGLHLEYSHHNILANSDCYAHIDGIRLMASLSNTLNNNTCYTNTQNGIFMSAASELNTLTNNTCYSSNHGIRISNSISNILNNNTGYENAQSGIFLSGSNNSTLTKNSCYNNTLYGIYLDNSNHTRIVENTCYDNDNTGISIFHSASSTVSNNTCYLDTWGGILLSNSNYSEVINNTCHDTVYAIGILGSVFNSLTKNTCYDYTDSGILLTFSSYIAFTENYCHGGAFGIYIEGSLMDILTMNTLHANHVGLLCLTCYDFEVMYNSFIECTTSAQDDIGTGVFDYNYWSDYEGVDMNGDGIGEMDYTFFDNVDSHPLVYHPSPPVFDELPGNIITEYSFSSFQLKLNATCITSMSWAVDNTLFDIDNQGMITSGVLPIGEYEIEVIVSNIYGIGTSTTFSVTVVDTTSPNWVIIPIDQNLEYNEALTYQVAATDLSGIDYWTISDIVNFWIDEYGVITNNTALSPGDYPLVVSVFDLYGNELSKAFTVHVNEAEDTTPPAWVTLTIHQSFGYDEMIEIQVEAWDESGIHHLWLNDTTHFSIDAFGVITNASTLEPGVYNLEVRAYDPNDNYCSAIILVTVLEPEIIPTVTITNTITVTEIITLTNATYPQDGLITIVSLSVGAGIGGAAVLILVVLFLKRRTGE